MIIMKFGGTSIGNADTIKSVGNIVSSNLKKSPVVVVSAVSGITNMLVKITDRLNSKNEAMEIVREIRKIHDKIINSLGINKDIINGIFEEFVKIVRTNKKNSVEVTDIISSYGERFSVRIVSAYLNSIGLFSDHYDAWEIGMITDESFGKAEPLSESYKKMSNVSKLNGIPIITGFIGKTVKGKVTTLGRGGSDYTAAIIGSAINSEEIQIWTDVNGIMSADPKIVKNSKTIPIMSFEEAAELAYFGAKVLHPKTILPAVKKNIPVRVLNTFNPKASGTLIVKESKSNNKTIKAIACKKNITVINIDSTRMLDAYGFLVRVFETFRQNKKSVDVVSTSEVSISLTIDNTNGLDNIVSELKEIADISYEGNKAIICVVGSGMKHTPGIAGRTFSVLGENRINVDMISQGASEINISFVVRNEDADNAVRLLHKEFFGV
ncbi:MAG: lysine-sensitive aspartokinase 3 [Nanoarchaeota archaeon]